MRMMTQAVFLMLLVGLSACASTNVYVLNQLELIRVHKGQQVNATYDGWLISDRGVSRVMDAKIKGVNLK